MFARTVCRHCAVQACWAAGVKALICNGASALARTPAGDTPLLWAAYKGDAEVAQALISAGADVNAMGDLGNRPLHLAASADHGQVRTRLGCAYTADCVTASRSSLMLWCPTTGYSQDRPCQAVYNKGFK